MRKIFAFGATGTRARVFIVEQWQEDETNSMNSTPMMFRTSSGLAVKYLSKGKYQIVETGDIITAAGPNSP